MCPCPVRCVGNASHVNICSRDTFSLTQTPRTRYFYARSVESVSTVLITSIVIPCSTRCRCTSVSSVGRSSIELHIWIDIDERITPLLGRSRPTLPLRLQRGTLRRAPSSLTIQGPSSRLEVIFIFWLPWQRQNQPLEHKCQ